MVRGRRVRREFDERTTIALRNRRDIWMNVRRKQGFSGLRHQDSVSLFACAV
jgi:hypothetical protein